MQRQSKGFFGDFFGSVLSPLGSIAGAAFGPIGSIVGGGLGTAVGGLAKKLPFKRGGVVVAMPMKMKKGKKGPAKGSTAMKAKMARLRAMRK